MKFGVCTGIENINTAQEIGYDYIEVNASALAELNEREFKEKSVILDDAGIKCECFNILFSWKTALLGNNASSKNDIENYLHHLFSRIKILNGNLVVFGGGKVRSYPKEMNFFDACRKLTEIIANIGRIASEYNLNIAIEPLNRLESNVLNTLIEGAMMTAQVNAENVCLLADSYHMFTDDEPLSNIERVGTLGHIHVATKNGRRYPVSEDELLVEFFSQLISVGYNERVSIEGNTDDFDKDARLALSTLKKLAEVK